MTCSDCALTYQLFCRIHHDFINCQSNSARLDLVSHTLPVTWCNVLSSPSPIFGPFFTTPDILNLLLDLYFVPFQMILTSQVRSFDLR